MNLAMRRYQTEKVRANMIWAASKKGG